MITKDTTANVSMIFKLLFKDLNMLLKVVRQSVRRDRTDRSHGEIKRSYWPMHGGLGLGFDHEVFNPS
jgi:hypothetical protein